MSRSSLSQCIPQRLADLLAEDDSLKAQVTLAVNEFDKAWLGVEGKRTPFFPDYTDHSTEHIVNVLETVVALIPAEVWDAGILTSRDAAVLILAVLLHDSGMHLSEDGFKTLISSNSRWGPIKPFDEKTWEQLWEDYRTKVRHFDDNTLRALFGEVIPIHSEDLDLGEMDVTAEKSRRLIGEFIRRHHPRLAHNIAIDGVPGPDLDDRLDLDIGEPKLEDLAGLVARSHGMSVRGTLDYLDEEYGRRVDPKRVRAVYLMVLLRIADYLQIQSERARKERTRVQSLKSPFSKVEWQVHGSIDELYRGTDEDPETYEIRAEPREVRAYLRLREWLEGLQEEIDDSWAVLGEVFGRQPREKSGLLAASGLEVRRIRSNVLEQDFDEEVSYVPKRVRFGTASARLLRLLIEPLYGDRPHIGIRELMQNAVDAVRERRAFVANHPEYEDRDGYEINGDVLVDVSPDEDGNWYCTVMDKGIGMTLETVEKYFLTAGASFRSSGQWKKVFQGAESSDVLRVGRFGIGVLAVFLIGKEVKVTTRHVTEEKALVFDATIETDTIEISREPHPVGTKIRVPIREGSSLTEKSSTRDWDWYCLKDPEVVRYFDGEKLSQSHTVPQPETDGLPRGWFRFGTKGEIELIWGDTHKAKNVCNGIVVSKSGKVSHEGYYRREGKYISILGTHDEEFLIPRPTICMFSKKEQPHLNLQRTELLDEEDLVGRSMKQRVKCFIGYILASLPTGERDELLANEYFHRRRYDGLERLPGYMVGDKVQYGSSPIMVSAESGFIFRNIWSIKNNEVSRVNFISSRYLNLNWRALIDKAGDNGIMSTVSEEPVEDDSPLAARMASLRLIDIGRHGGEVTPGERIPQFLVAKSNIREMLSSSYIYEELGGGWIILGVGGVEGEPRSELMEMVNTVRSSGDENVMVSEWCLDQIEARHSSRLSTSWRFNYATSKLDSMIDHIEPIPFKSVKRKEVINNVGNEIKEFFLYWRSILN